MKPLSNNLLTNRSLASLLLVSAICISSMAGASNSASTDASVNPSANTSAAQTNNKTKGELSDTTAHGIEHGKEIHKNHCYKCHTDEVYTRENRFVKSIDALSKQVKRCKDGNNIPWFDEDTDAVVQFLNKKYYRF